MVADRGYSHHNRDKQDKQESGDHVVPAAEDNHRA